MFLTSIPLAYCWDIGKWLTFASEPCILQPYYSTLISSRALFFIFGQLLKIFYIEMISLHKNSFIFFPFPTCIPSSPPLFLSYFISQIFCRMLKNSREKDFLALFLILVKSLEFLTIKYVNYRGFVYILCQVEEVPTINKLLSFSHEWMLNFDIVVFFL